MESTAQPVASGAVGAVKDDPILKAFKTGPHQVFGPEDFVKTINPKAVKDPEKRSEVIAEIKITFDRYVKEGHIREVADGIFKSRLFFDEEQFIEHAFIGGMENPLYAFQSTLFRLNIGVLSVYFIKDSTKNNWLVTVRDTTIGKDYCLTQRLVDGTYVMGGVAPTEVEKNFLLVPGRYIIPRHLTLTLSGESIKIEDHRTAYGTRIDHFTEEGLKSYRELAQQYLKTVDPKEKTNPVKKGRYVLDHFIQHHKNFEATFFSMTVDSLLLTEA